VIGVGVGEEDGVRRFAWERHAGYRWQFARRGVVQRGTGVEEDAVLVCGDFNTGAADLAGASMDGDAK
jgi:hypothetical protein